MKGTIARALASVQCMGVGVSVPLMGVGAVYVVVLRLFLARSSKQKAVVNEQF